MSKRGKIDTKKVFIAIAGIIVLLVLWNAFAGSTPLGSGVIDGVSVQIVNEIGEVLETLTVVEKPTGILADFLQAITATWGGTTTTIDTYLYPSSGSNYFKFMASATPTFTKSPSTAVAKVTYSLTWNSNTYNSAAYTETYLGTRIAGSGSTLTLPYTAPLITIDPATSGASTAFGDANQFIVAKISGPGSLRDMLPAGQTSRNFVTTCSVVASLYIDGTLMNSVTQPATVTIIVTNTAGTGSMSSVSASITIGFPTYSYP